MNAKRILSVIVLSAVSFALFAHPGHGFFEGHTIAHYLVSYSHFIPIAGIAVGVFLLMKKKRKTSKERELN